MKYYDVLFPLKLKPLTYSSDSNVPLGSLARVELRKSIATGVVIAEAVAPPQGVLKPIESHSPTPFLSHQLLGLVSWMADYYMTQEGIVLKELLPSEYFDLGESVKETSRALLFNSPTAETAVFQAVSEQIKKTSYKTFLLHSSSIADDLSLVSGLAGRYPNIIILCPEIGQMEHARSVIHSAIGDRVAMIHGSMSKKQRRDVIGRIIEGEVDVVVGARMALLTPLRRASLIVVLNEESPSYKKEDGLRYNIRDIAVMRGYQESATVLLTSLCPSVESFYNASIGKYSLLRQESAGKRPAFRLVDMRNAKKFSPYISKPVKEKTVSAVNKGKRVGFLVKRSGFSYLRCPECAHVEECPTCETALTFHKSDKSLRCRICGHKSEPRSTCSKCQSPKIEPYGAGIERLEEDLKSLLDINPEIVESLNKKPEVDYHEDSLIVIGTGALAKRTELGGAFSLVSVLNGDFFLHMPDFRALEKAFQGFLRLSAQVEPEGEILIQTWNARIAFYGFLKRYDFDGFYEKELAEREAMNYPPFSRLALVISPKENTLAKLKERLSNNKVEVLGPASAIDKKGKPYWKLLIKSPDRKTLRKALKGIDPNEVVIDIDPMNL